MGVASEIGQKDDLANVTEEVDRAKDILPMMIHWDSVHLKKVGLAKRIAQTQVGQVDEEVLYIGQRLGFAYETVLQNMMDYSLDCFRLARKCIQNRM